MDASFTRRDQSRSSGRDALKAQWSRNLRPNPWREPDLAVFATGYNPIWPCSRSSGKGLADVTKAVFAARLSSKGARNPRSPAPIGPSRIKVDTSFARMISVEHTWHRLRRRFAEAPGAEHQNSKLGVFGNKPHPPREVEASAFASRFIFCLAMCLIRRG